MNSVRDCGCDVYGISALAGLGVPCHHKTKEAPRAEKLSIGPIEERVSPGDTISDAVIPLGL